ncbi:ABC transporter permease [Allostreptomyces psammosilenae]|uniref:Peptide/nickel transport system permease protein n=1 Tax=Allostreptomyces psammosilenae TaxID=1892865 RepID=A0A852ZRD8_9ACTN|nr:ABC transporter permease [Allostreptomyces psammosilenae]NYI04335.1 peptide/nickel transport system permease protein [Allostreptomyces psammosilenae]
MSEATTRPSRAAERTGAAAPPAPPPPGGPRPEPPVKPDGPVTDPGGAEHPEHADHPGHAEPSRRRARAAAGPLAAALSALRRPAGPVAALVLALVLAWAVAPGAFTATDPLVGVPAERLLPPSPDHWFGTDHLGRDIHARVVHGAALSLTATVIAVLVGLVAGSLLGLVSGYLGGPLDDVLMRAVDVLLAIPGLLLSLAVVTALGFGTTNVALAVGVTSVAAFARLMRAEVRAVRASAYVEAAVAAGVRWPAVLRRHVLPNSAGPVLALAALEFGGAFLSVSALSFLGYGAAPPAPEWGSLVSEGRNYLATAWWYTTLPGLVIIAVVLSAHRLGRSLENRRDPR